MDGEQRREALLQMLGDAREPLSGSALARRLGVSRQVQPRYSFHRQGISAL